MSKSGSGRISDLAWRAAPARGRGISARSNITLAGEPDYCDEAPSPARILWLHYGGVLGEVLPQPRVGWRLTTRRRIRTPALLAGLVVALALTGCNRDRPDPNAGGTGGGAGQGGSTPAYNIGGTITGLTASGLSLAIANNMVSVAAGATAFTLPHMLATGTSYTVTVQSQPQGQTCALANAFRHCRSSRHHQHQGDLHY